LQLCRLLPQLSTSADVPTDKHISEILRSESSHLLVAREDKTREDKTREDKTREDRGNEAKTREDGAEEGNEILGFLTLVVFPIPTGIRAWIEDVIVDSSARGKGVGQSLTQFAIELADQYGAKTVDLTSRSSREAANRLYKRLGFIERETNVYRYTIKL